MTLPRLARSLPTIAAPVDGKWVLYTGGEMRPQTQGLMGDGNDAVSVRLVVDLATLSAPAAIPCLYNHCDWDLLGKFTPTITPEAVVAGLDLTRPADEAEAEALRNVVALTAHIRNNVPLQCSAGFEAGPAGTWERIPAGQVVTVNGKTFTGGDDSDPLFVLRGGLIYEASLLTFGADDNTGRAAAHRHPSPRNAPAMSTAARLKALAAKFDAKHHAKILALCAEDKTDDQIASCIEADDQAALQARCDAAEAKVAELQAQVTDLQAQLAAKNPAADATATATRGVKPVPHTAAGQKAEASAVDAPKTISDGIRVVLGENPTMKPLAARAEARKRWPDLKHG